MAGKKTDEGQQYGLDIEELVRIQQRCVGRFFDVWANAATRVSHGNFDASQWSKEYTLMLEESLDDYGQLLKTFFRSKKDAQ